MFREVDRVIEEAMHLTPEERIEVADRLYESVPEDEIAKAWLEEVKRRDAEWDAGIAEGFELDVVLREARARIRK